MRTVKYAKLKRERSTAKCSIIFYGAVAGKVYIQTDRIMESIGTQCFSLWESEFLRCSRLTVPQTYRLGTLWVLSGRLQPCMLPLAAHATIPGNVGCKSSFKAMTIVVAECQTFCFDMTTQFTSCLSITLAVACTGVSALLSAGNRALHVRYVLHSPRLRRDDDSLRRRKLSRCR